MNGGAMDFSSVSLSHIKIIFGVQIHFNTAKLAYTKEGRGWIIKTWELNADSQEIYK